MSDRACHHDRSIESTLHTAFTDEIDGWQLWWVYCDACGRKTDLCLTWQEATARALKEWWADKYVKVMRCRDCRFSLAHGNGCGRNQDIYDVEPDGFCAWGEWRSE